MLHNSPGLLTRNGSLDLEPPSDKAARKKAFDLLAAAALPGSSVDTSGRVLSLPTLGKFCETRQHEPKSEQQLKNIIQVIFFWLQLSIYLMVNETGLPVERTYFILMSL